MKNHNNKKKKKEVFLMIVFLRIYINTEGGKYNILISHTTFVIKISWKSIIHQPSKNFLEGALYMTVFLHVIEIV